jgi:serine/threonine-protein kinase
METIGKYRILGTLGKGGMGIVYKAMDPDIERPVAIKAVRFDTLPEGLEIEDLLARIVREAKAAGRLNHPNIITIYDVIRDQDMTYIVMQYVDGPSLQALLASGKSFSPREVLDILRPVSDALDFAHRSGIIHRDIKPANILIDRSGQPFLADFGVARILTSTITQTGTTVGTLNYMSPEQVKGQTVDSRSDVFALGVVLYELLTGKKPFAGDNMSTVVYQIVNEQPQPVSDINKELHGGYERIVNKALAKSPEDRYQTCLEMIADLENPASMAEATLAYETAPAAGPKPQKRRTGLFVATAIAVVAVLSGGAYLLFSSRPAKSSEFARKPETIKTPVAGVETAAPEDAALVKLRRSYDAKSYQETVRLAKEILAREPANASAQDYLKKANAELLASQMAELLESGIAGYGSGDYARCAADMEKVLAIDKNNQEARRYLLQAQTALTTPEITGLIKRHQVAVENKDLLTVLSLYDSSSPADGFQSEFKLLFNGYDGIKSIISKVTVSLSGAQGATAGFSELLTGVSKKTGQRKIVFEGLRTWRLRKLPTGWKISAVQ